MLDRTDPHTESAAPRNAIMPRATAELIVRQRNIALERYEVAHAALSSASEATIAAHAAARAINPREGRFNYHLDGDKVKFMRVDDVQPCVDYMKVAKRIVDTEAWSRILEITDLERLMDKQAKDEMYQQLLSDPPEATLENISATLEQFAADAETIFRRGIANCFSKLDRRFRSHDGFKIGSRVILDRMFDEHGWWNYHRDMESTLLDIERTFMVIEGLTMPPSYAGIVGRLRSARERVHGARQSVVENEYFRVNIYKNGNCHCWFKRDDIVEKVNKLLAEYYGEVIPDGMTPEDDGGLYEPKTTPAKRYGFFPTPEDAARKTLDGVSFLREKDEPQLTILEPSAGAGNLARRCFSEKMLPEMGAPEWKRKHCASHNARHRFDNAVDCVEIQPQLAEDLQREGIYRKVYRADFLSLNPETTGLYDRVVMNPPFDRERDIDHVIHALDFLKPDGLLVAIMSAGTEFRETRKSIAFRDLMIGKMKGRFTDLPPASFASVGTYINTIVLKVCKNGAPVSRW
jgi:hypothetical protein